MKILVTNGSPRGENGNTQVLVKEFMWNANHPRSPAVSNKEMFVKHVNAYFERMGLTRI